MRVLRPAAAGLIVLPVSSLRGLATASVSAYATSSSARGFLATMSSTVRAAALQEPETCVSASLSLSSAAGIPSFGTSIHCEFDKKYSSSGLSAAASSRNAMIGLRLEAARSTSLATCDDDTALPDSTSTTALTPL
jgi:hypothetical protein